MIASGSVELVVGFAPGGASDVLARALARPMADALGLRVEVRNEAGDGGIAAAQLVAQSGPDGSRLLVGNNGLLAANPVLVENLGYDPARDFEPVILIGRQPSVLVAGPSLGARTVGELVDCAKASPDGAACAVSGHGAAAHLAARLFQARAGIALRERFYQGAAPALRDLADGEVDLMFATISSVLGHIAKARVRPIAVTTVTRASLLGDVPTMAELGFPGFEVASWHGLVAPAGTPAEVIDTLCRAASRVLRERDVQASLVDLGIEIASSSPAGFAAFIAAERPKWAAIVDDSGFGGLHRAHYTSSR